MVKNSLLSLEEKEVLLQAIASGKFSEDAQITFENLLDAEVVASLEMEKDLKRLLNLSKKKKLEEQKRMLLQKQKVLRECQQYLAQITLDFEQDLQKISSDTDKKTEDLIHQGESSEIDSIHRKLGISSSDA